jgi:hypothetical protein
MTEASSDVRRSWTRSTNERPNSLEISLLKRSFVLPWSQFLYAEGGEDEVRLAFSTHDILVTGNHLGLLLADLSAQRVGQLQEPIRAERFGSSTEPQIISISVRKVE